MGTTAEHVGDCPVLVRSVAMTFVDTSVLHPLRRRVARLLADLDADVRVDAELVCTELVVNALEHADGPWSVHVRLFTGGQLHVTVVDASPSAALTSGSSQVAADRGRGLSLVGAVGDWDVTRGATGKAITATLPRGT